MMKVLILGLLTIMSVACLNSSSGGSKNVDPVQSDKPAPQMPDYVPDPNGCDQHADESSPYGEWIGKDYFSENPDSRSLVLNIGESEMTMSALCYDLDANPLEAKVETSIHVSESSIEMMNQAADHVAEEFYGRVLTCDIEIKPSTVEYSFKGGCLVIHQGDDKLYLLRKK